ncbi:MAG: hypothetical protein Kow00107_07040 [Planctomycetota bacterium]
MPQAERGYQSAELLRKAVALLVLAAPFMYSINLGLVRHKGEAAGPYVSIVDILTLILTVAVGSALVILRDWRSLRFPASASIALVLWYGLGLFRLTPDVSVSRGGLLKETIQLFEYLCLGYALFVFAMNSRRRIGFFMDALALSCTAVTLYGLYQLAFTDTHPFLLGSTFENNNLLSAWCAVTAPLLLGWALATSSWPKKLWIASLVVASIPLVLNGWFLIVMALGIILMFSLYGEWSAITVAAITALVFGVVFTVSPKENAQRIVTSISLYHQLDPSAARELNRTHVASARVRNWQAALLTGASRPWTGYGASSYAPAVKENFFFDPKYTERTDKIEAFDVHVDEPNSFSTYLIILVENGIVGLLILAALLGAAFRWAGAAAFSDGSVRYLGRGALASLAVLFAGGQFINIFERGTAFLSVFVLALAFCLYEQAKGYTDN